MPQPQKMLKQLPLLILVSCIISSCGYGGFLKECNYDLKENCDSIKLVYGEWN